MNSEVITTPFLMIAEIKDISISAMAKITPPNCDYSINSNPYYNAEALIKQTQQHNNVPQTCLPLANRFVALALL